MNKLITAVTLLATAAFVNADSLDEKCVALEPEVIEVCPDFTPSIEERELVDIHVDPTIEDPIVCIFPPPADEATPIDIDPIDRVVELPLDDEKTDDEKLVDEEVFDKEIIDEEVDIVINKLEEDGIDAPVLYYTFNESIISPTLNSRQSAVSDTNEVVETNKISGIDVKVDTVSTRILSVKKEPVAIIKDDRVFLR